MKNGLIVLIFLVALIFFFFIPFTRKETVAIKIPFLKVYRELLVARNWANWNNDIKKDFEADSNKVIFTKNPDGFNINSPSTALHSVIQASFFTVMRQSLKGDYNYQFAIIPDKNGLRTRINVTSKTSLFGLIKGLFVKQPLASTGINDFKNYMENDSLYYGYRIYKIRVPQADLITIRKQVLKTAAYTEVASSYTDLRKFVADNNLKKMQPVIAQFIPKGIDSIQVNVGLFIDREIKSTGYVTYVHMPKGGPLIVIDYKGEFNKRGKAYAALHRYFIDHNYQSAVLPFETYYDDKLPKSETDNVYMRINFTSFQ